MINLGKMIITNNNRTRTMGNNSFFTNEFKYLFINH